MIVQNVKEIWPNPFKVGATAVCDINNLVKLHTNRAAGS